jgi:hypothetical protein
MVVSHSTGNAEQGRWRAGKIVNACDAAQVKSEDDHIPK